MAERRTSHDGLAPTNRHRSPSLDHPQYHYESLDAALNAQPGGSSRTRRRVSRTNSSGKVSTASASASCVDGEWDSGKRSKSSRNTLKKTHRRDSAYSDISVGSYDSQGVERRDSSGYVPRLSQISEGKVSRAKGHSQGTSEISSSSGSRSHRRRRHEEQGEDHTRTRRRHGSSKRHGASPTRSTLSSVASPSEVTYSSVSTASETTPTAHRRRSRKAQEAGITEIMEATETDVFQYMSESPQEANFTVEEAHDTPPSTSAHGSSASESDGEGEEGQSSDSEDSHTGETPTTSPASMRRSHADTPEEPRHGYRAPKVPLYASSFVHGHDDGEEEEEEEDSAEESDEQSDDGEEEDGSDVVRDEHAQHQALERTLPPTAPPIPAPNDHHAERLRQRERDLATHVLQSPQPQKDFKFSGEPSAHPKQPMPLYSPRAYTAAPSAATYDAPAGYPAEWPPFPPPLPIGYPTQSTMESPTGGHPLPLAVQPPAGVPNLPPQHLPQHQQYPGQPPPHYQAHMPTTDMSKTTVAGYELLANKLSEPPKGSKSPRKDRAIVPMYRKFEYLNHRVLLHLQDEICELEEELRELDECIVQMSPKTENGTAYPASRRGDAEFGGEVHYKRTELLGRIFQKLGQYNQAFTAFTQLLHSTSPPSPTDIQSYRTWLDKRALIDKSETRFLDRKHDLLAVSRKNSSASPVRANAAAAAAPTWSWTLWAPMLVVVPLLVVAVMPGLVGWVIVVGMAGGVLGFVIAKGELGVWGFGGGGARE